MDNSWCPYDESALTLLPWGIAYCSLCKFLQTQKNNSTKAPSLTVYDLYLSMHVHGTWPITNIFYRLIYISIQDPSWDGYLFHCHVVTSHPFIGETKHCKSCPPQVIVSLVCISMPKRTIIFILQFFFYSMCNGILESRF